MKWFSRSKKSNEWAENPTPVRRVGGVRVGGTDGVIANGMGGEAGSAAERKVKFGHEDRSHGAVDISGGHEIAFSTGHGPEAERGSQRRIPTIPYDSGKVRVGRTGDGVLGNGMGGPAGSSSVPGAWEATKYVPGAGDEQYWVARAAARAGSKSMGYTSRYGRHHEDSSITGGFRSSHSGGDHGFGGSDGLDTGHGGSSGGGMGGMSSGGG